eukprot:TRINITY_DN4873_c0_g1_i1.p1 TRINITY_DN4873_c0_g1~~TRINITY_DN4873_c0_g1_i1.p1  ORF type:complete len:252 (+),score=74.64 TRINITY_DN4873_c0_g1_i1:100-756(+)
MPPTIAADTKIPTLVITSDKAHYQTGYTDATTGLFTVTNTYTYNTTVMGPDDVINWQYDPIKQTFIGFSSYSFQTYYFLQEFGLVDDFNKLTPVPRPSGIQEYPGLGLDPSTGRIFTVGSAYKGTKFSYLELDRTSATFTVITSFNLYNNREISSIQSSIFVDGNNGIMWVNIWTLSGIYMSQNWIAFDITTGNQITPPCSPYFGTMTGTITAFSPYN